VAEARAKPQPPKDPSPTPPPRGEGLSPPSLAGKGVGGLGLFPLLAALLFFALAMVRALGPDDPRDFYIFRLGAELTLRGENPYDVPKVREHIRAQFPKQDAAEFVANSGYFLPPLAVVAFVPFAVLPWLAAKVAWAVLNAVAAYFIARLPLMLRDRDSPAPHVLLYAVVPFVLLLNPLALAIPFPVGQFTIVFVGCVAAGLLAFERGRPHLAAVLWVLPFAKPHLALPLIPLAWYLGGWRPAALLVVLVGVINLAGAWAIGGTPLYLKDYFEFLPQAREAVAFNRVESNPQITSWNSLLYHFGQQYKLGLPLIELGAVTIAAGYLVWVGLLVGRCAATNSAPSAAWVAAATAVGGVLCAQVLVYELLFLAVAVPWIRDLFAGGPRARVWGCLAIALLAWQFLPLHRMEALGMGFYRPLGVFLFALVVLTGPTARVTSSDSSR
jgi:hypothetical protein